MRSYARIIIGGLTIGAAAIAPAAEPLLLHVGGTMRPAMEQICKLYEQETGEKVEVNHNDSGAVIAVIETTGKGDLCVVHDPFPAAIEKKGFADRTYYVATLTPVIAVRKGNPKGIRSIHDLARPDVKVGLTDAIYSTGGHIVPLIFSKAGIGAAMEAKDKDIVRARSGGEIANAVKVGTVDAGIVWNAVTFARRNDLDAIPIDDAMLPQRGVDAVTTATYGVLDMSQTKVAVLILKQSKRPDAARKLAELAASDRGQKIFRDLGFSAAPAAAAPAAAQLGGSLFVYCAAGVREPIAEIARQFESDTGVRVDMTFANSGQLLGQVDTTRLGDVYIPGDLGFAAKAQEKGLVAGEPTEFCSFLPGIYVRKGNPKAVRGLADLARPGMRLALADESAAIGKLLPELCRKNGVDPEALKGNTKVSPATVTDVALAVKMATVDAGIIWTALGSMYPDDAEIVAIPPDKNMIGKVAACALAGSKNPRAASAFVAFLRSGGARAILKSKGLSID